MAEIFEGDDATLRGEVGLSRLTFLDKAMYANYDESQPSSNVHFMIAEGDNRVMEFDAAFTTHDGDAYHNQDCLVIQLRDGKIAEVREHADTRYSERVCIGTPDKRVGVLDRLASQRAGEKL